MSEDINIENIKVPLSIKKALDSGQIVKAYREIYELAGELSAAEARKFRKKKLADGMVSLKESLNDGQEPQVPSVDEIKEQAAEYQNKRLDFHIKEMVRSLESYSRKKPVRKHK